MNASIKKTQISKAIKGHKRSFMFKNPQDTQNFIIFKKQAITQLTFIFVIIFKLNYFCLN